MSKINVLIKQNVPWNVRRQIDTDVWLTFVEKSFDMLLNVHTFCTQSQL